MFFFNDTAAPEIYPYGHTLSLPDALPIFVASIVTNGPGPLLGTEAGQRVVQEAYRATAPAPPPGVTVAGRGDTIPAFTVPGLDGTPVDVSVAWAGKPMLINIWASWCGP